MVAAPLKKTAIYIDGYNLYYSRLRGTAFKWLDIVALFRDRILQVQDPSAQVTRVKFFTAPIKANYARHGQASEHAQAQYHRALTAKYPELVQEPKAFTSSGRRRCPPIARVNHPARPTSRMYG